MTDLKRLQSSVYWSTGFASICSARKDASVNVTAPPYASSIDCVMYLACVRVRPSRTLPPMIITSGTAVPSLSAASIWSLTSLTTRELMPPHRPLSEDTASVSSDSGLVSSSSEGVRIESISVRVDCANGRAASIMRSAVLSFAAATIFIAFVIFAVEVVDLIRIDSCFSDMAGAAVC